VSEDDLRLDAPDRRVVSGDGRFCGARPHGRDAAPGMVLVVQTAKRVGDVVIAGVMRIEAIYQKAEHQAGRHPEHVVLIPLPFLLGSGDRPARTRCVCADIHVCAIGEGVRVYLGRRVNGLGSAAEFLSWRFVDRHGDGGSVSRSCRRRLDRHGSPEIFKTDRGH